MEEIGARSAEMDRQKRAEHDVENSAEKSKECSVEGNLKDDLRTETLKWLEKAEMLFCQVSGDEHFLENVSAYIQDSQYFLEKGDLIRAFEAVIWAWAWMEIGLEKKLLQQKSVNCDL